jgi:predicted methyltransferase
MNRLSRLAPAFALMTSLVACGGGSASAPTAGSPSTPSTPAAPAASTAAPPAGVDAATDAKLKQAIAGSARTDKEKARDRYRHPLETLELFGLKDDMTVVEMSPGGGWYTSILAPVLREKGKLIVAGGDPNGDPKSEGTKNAQALLARFKATPAVFDKVQAVVVKRDQLDLGPDGSVDMIVTFRNFHNWTDDKKTHEKFLAVFFKALKHGGVLGIEDHRAKPGTAFDAKAVDDSGYIPEDFVIKAIEGAGFKLAGKSEVNANPKDTKDYPKGVWTLPPTYEMGEKDHAKYEAIGESDRMTLKFVKP